MKTLFTTEKKYINILNGFVQSLEVTGDLRPTKFLKKMKKNTGNLHNLHPYGLDEQGLERRNPIIVALGDSVTAGHFEFIGKPEDVLKKIQSGQIAEEEYLEIADVRKSYPELFRNMLIDKYGQTALTVVNCGIAGDNLYSMQKRLYRDVIQIQPDLVLINGSLNWNAELGDSNRYEEMLTNMVRQIKIETNSDIILMTPNMEISSPFQNSVSPLEERVERIRRVARQEQVCLADTYIVWQEYCRQGHPIDKLLANGINHPSAQAHEIFANVLMRLIDR